MKEFGIVIYPSYQKNKRWLSKLIRLASVAIGPIMAQDGTIKMVNPVLVVVKLG